MTHGSLFSGIGGFDLAAEWAGWENKFHCEWNEFGKRVLKHYWPDAASYHDITKTDFTIWRGKIDVLTGGFPCQPYSLAGKRKGKEDDRHLWPEMLRVIREVQTTWVVGENVPGIINWNGGLVFDEVQSDLENEGYEIIPFVLPACGVNAPHRRERVWFVAHSKSNGNRGILSRMESKNAGERESEKHGQKDMQPWNNGTQRNASNPCNNGTSSHTNGGRQSSEKHRQAEPRRITETRVPDNWKDFPTQPPVCSRNDGLSSRLSGITFPKWRNESIKACGNAIVPQVVYQIFKAINEYELLNK